MTKPTMKESPKSPRWPKLRDPRVPAKVRLRGPEATRTNPRMEAAIRSDGFWTSATMTSPRLEMPPPDLPAPQSARENRENRDRAPRQRLQDALDEKMAKTTQSCFAHARAQAVARLATPKEPGASERTQRRALSREYAAYAKEAAAALLPDVAATSEGFHDLWHTSGDDGYKSAIFHAAVRCRELQRSFGIEDNSDGTYVFGGGEGSPELFRLHQACVLFEELGRVSSPLRDTLRFLQREMLNCIFANYKTGADLLQLTPFFVLRSHEMTHMEECEQRRAEADLEIEASHRRLEEAKKQVQSLKQQLQKDRQNAQKENESYEVVISQRNELRQKIEGLRESNNLRFDELRETNAELSSLQASSYLTRKDLDQARKDMATMNVQLKESNAKVLMLSKRVSDLQDALALMSNEGSRISSKVVSRNAPQGANLELPNELEMELNVITSRVSSKKKKKAEDPSAHFGHERSTVDGRRLLRALMPQGGYQVVLKATVEDQMGLQPASTPAVAAAAAAASRRGGKEGIPPVLIVSGEAFAALAISQGLPLPPDPLQYTAHDDEDLVKEVGHDVQLLSEEYGMLLELYRGLRQDLKRTLRLVPDFNTDELRGALQNVMILDSEERSLVPPPVLETEFIGLGEGPDVPPYLRFVGSISTKLLSSDLVKSMCEELWLSKTQHVLQEELLGRPQMPLDAFINEKFLPARAGGRPHQMELIYNFLVALRQSTTLKDNHAPDGALHVMPTENAKRGSRVGPARRRRSSAVRRMSGEGQTIELPEVCPSCGNIFAPDAIFCRMCRTKRPGMDEKEKSESQICSCGNVFMPDAVFCRRCGSERPKDQGPSSDKRNKGQDLLLLNFDPFSETLYRGLLRDMHEDTFHDATTMLLNLCSCLHALQHRFRSSASRLIEDDESCTLQEMNVSVLSAVLRLFFPRKPREHLTALKSMLHSKAQLNAVRTRDKLKSRAGAVQFQEEGKDEPNLPPSIAIKEIFGLPPMDEHGRMVGGHRALLENLLRSPTPFILELRRQHLLECILATDKLQRALRVNRKNSGQAQGSAAADEPAQMAAKEILEALGKADRDLTADQRHVYLLRGFGRRLPDMPSTTEMDLGNEALKAAIRANKVRRMLQDYAQEVVQSGAQVVVEDFLRNLQSSGVVKSGKSWEAALSLQDVAKESGISAMVVISPGKSIMDELMAAHIASGTAQEEGTHRPVSNQGRTFSKHANKSFPPPPANDSEPFDHYAFFSELGQDVQELSLGYSASYLSFWVNNSL